MTDKQRAIIQTLSPIIATLFFTFFIFTAREFVSTVRAEQTAHTIQINELREEFREKATEMRYIKEALERIEKKLDGAR